MVWITEKLDPSWNVGCKLLLALKYTRIESDHNNSGCQKLHLGLTNGGNNEKCRFVHVNYVGYGFSFNCQYKETNNCC